MSLENLIADDTHISVSFEFSPPKTDEAEAQLWQTIKRLEPLQPSFVSVTYGAGGSTRARTHATVKRIVEETSLKPAAHLTCVGASCAGWRSMRSCGAIGMPASAISWRCAVTCPIWKGLIVRMTMAIDPRRN